MRDIDIPLRPDLGCEQIARIIDQAIIQAALRTTLRDSLKRFPGSIHWHVKNGRETGTLEIMLWPKEYRAWFTIQDGRKASWINAKMKLMHQIILQKLDNA